MLILFSFKKGQKVLIQLFFVHFHIQEEKHDSTGYLRSKMTISWFFLVSNFVVYM